MSLVQSVPSGAVEALGFTKPVDVTTLTFPANSTTFKEVTPEGRILVVNYSTPYPPAIPPANRVRISLVQTDASNIVAELPLVLREPFPTRLTQASFNWLKIINELRITSGTYTGGFRYGENNGISWYFDNVGLYHLCADLVLPNSPADLILPHINLFVANLLADYTIKNVAADLTTLTNQDADDSNAAVFIILVERYLRLTNNWAWLTLVHGNPLLPASQTNHEMLIALANANITTQFKTPAWVAAYDPTAVASGLPSVFQFGNAPGGGTYSFGLLQDSAECAKSLRLLGQLLVDIGDQNGPTFLQHSVNLSNVIHGMFNVDVNDWMWNDGQVNQTGTFTVNTSTGNVTVSGFTPTQNLAVMVGPSVGGSLPTPLSRYTVYWFRQNGANWQLSPEFNASGTTESGGSGSAITFSNTGSGTLHIMVSGASWYPDLMTSPFVEMHDVRSTAIISTGTCNYSTGTLTKISGSVNFDASMEKLTIVIGSANFQIIKVNSPTSATIFPNTGSGTGATFNIYGPTVTNTLIDTQKYNDGYEKMCAYSPSWWERPGSAAFPDMFAGFYVAKYRQDLVKASAKFNTLAGYYLVPHQPTNGLNNISEIGFARELMNMLVTPFATGRNAAFPDTEFQVKKVTSTLLASPPTTPQFIDSGVTISPSGQVVPLSTSIDYLVTAVPSISRGSDGQDLFLINFGSHTITLQDSGTLAGSNMRLSDTQVPVLPLNIVHLKYFDAAGYWIQVTTPLALRDFVFPPSTVQALVAGTQIDPSSTVIPLSASADITLTHTPTIAAGRNGQVIELVNTGVHFIKLQSDAVLSGSKLQLPQPTVELDAWSTIRFVYLTAAAMWIQLGQPVAKSLVLPELIVGGTVKVDGDEIVTVNGKLVMNGVLRAVSSVIISSATASKPAFLGSSKEVTSGDIDLTAGYLANLLPIGKGGTGQNNAAAARTALGVYDTSYIDAQLASIASSLSILSSNISTESSRAIGVENAITASKADHGTYPVSGVPDVTI